MLRGQPCAMWLQLCVFLVLELGSGFGFVLFPLLPSRTHTRHFSTRPLFANRIGVLTDTNHARKDQAIGDAIEDIMSPSIILVRPFLDKNVGTVARAMLNFGITDLRLVDPQCDHLSSDARALASGATGLAPVPFPIFCAPDLLSTGVLELASVFPTVEAAVADLVAVFATTARLRDMTYLVCPRIHKRTHPARCSGLFLFLPRARSAYSTDAQRPP